MGGNPCGSVFSTPQVIHISKFRSLALIVNILWGFKKCVSFSKLYFKVV